MERDGLVGKETGYTEISAGARADGLTAAPGLGGSLRQYALLVGAGAFATTFAQLRILGNYPITFLLKEQYSFRQEEVAAFFFWATFAWNLKPLAGILTDAFPLFGTRRRHYMMLGAALAGVFWMMMGASVGNYPLLLTFAVLANLATVFASTVMGGLMVEAGQSFGIPGRIASLRQLVQSVAHILAPLLGGYLASRAFGWTTGIAASCVIALAVLTWKVLREPPYQPLPRAELSAGFSGRSPRPSLPTLLPAWGLGLVALYLSTVPDLRNIGISLFALLGTFLLIVLIPLLPSSNAVLFRAQSQLGLILGSRALWMAAGMLLLVYTVPGLYTALIYQQTDVLKFSKPLIGWMAALEAGAGTLAAVGYSIASRRLQLRTLLFAGIGLNAAATLLYLVYSYGTAPLVHLTVGFATILSELALMHLAVCATPRGCEALGFSLMMSVRNFGLAMSDILGTKLVDRFQVSFHSLVLINAATTAVILLFLPLLPGAVASNRDGDTAN